ASARGPTAGLAPVCFSTTEYATCPGRSTMRLAGTRADRAAYGQGGVPSAGGYDPNEKEPGQGRAPRCARWRREALPDSGQGTVVDCDRSAVKGGNGRRPEAFDDQINAQRKLPDCDRDCEIGRSSGRDE